MQFKVEWSKPLTLTDATAQGLMYSLPAAKVPLKPGIYVFGRMHGRKFEALYVGKAENLQRRTQQHLKNLRLMLHLSKAKSGSRVLLFGVLNTNSGSKIQKGIPILERAFIRYFLA